MGVLLDEQRIAEKVEVINRIALAFDQILQLILYFINPKGRVDASSFDCVDSSISPTRDLANEKEVLFAKALRELVDHRGKVAGRSVSHVLDRVNAEAIDVSECDPVFVYFAQDLQNWGRSEVVHVIRAEGVVFEVVKVAVEVFRVIVPIADGTFLGETDPFL